MIASVVRRSRGPRVPEVHAGARGASARWGSSGSTASTTTSSTTGRTSCCRASSTCGSSILGGRRDRPAHRHADPGEISGSRRRRCWRWRCRSRSSAIMHASALARPHPLRPRCLHPARRRHLDLPQDGVHGAGLGHPDPRLLPPSRARPKLAPLAVVVLLAIHAAVAGRAGSDRRAAAAATGSARTDGQRPHVRLRRDPARRVEPPGVRARVRQLRAHDATESSTSEMLRQLIEVGVVGLPPTWP